MGSDGTKNQSVRERADDRTPPRPTMRWRVFIVEDQPLAQEGLRAMLNAIDDVEVVGVAGDPDDAIRLIDELGSNLVLMDINSPGAQGLDATHRIKHELPDTTIVVITSRDDAEIVVDAFRAGAVGFISKSADVHDIEEMLHSIAVDGVYLRTADTGRLLNAMESQHRGVERVVFTHRERQVLDLLAEGMTARRIADRLGIGERTVHTYVGAVYRKLGVSNKVAAVRAAIKAGVMSAEL